MKTYLTFAPLALFIVWIYLAADWFKSQQDFKNQSGVNSFNPFQSFRFFFKSKNELERSAYDNMKQRSWWHLKIWLISIILFVIVTIVVGILTAKRGQT